MGVSGGWVSQVGVLSQHRRAMRITIKEPSSEISGCRASLTIRIPSNAYLTRDLPHGLFFVQPQCSLLWIISSQAIWNKENERRKNKKITKCKFSLRLQIQAAARHESPDCRRYSFFIVRGHPSHEPSFVIPLKRNTNRLLYRFSVI